MVYDSEIALYVGDVLQLKLQVKMSDDTLVDVTEQALGWTSSDGSVATVTADGRVAAAAVGKATITVQYEGWTAAYNIGVAESPISQVATAADMYGNGVDFLEKDADGVYVLTAASDANTYLFIWFQDKIAEDSVTVSGMPDAQPVGVHPGNEWLYVIRYGAMSAGSNYELIITGLEQLGPPRQPMGTIRIRLRR